MEIAISSKKHIPFMLSVLKGNTALQYLVTHAIETAYGPEALIGLRSLGINLKTVSSFQKGGTYGRLLEAVKKGKKPTRQMKDSASIYENRMAEAIVSRRKNNFLTYRFRASTALAVVTFFSAVLALYQGDISTLFQLSTPMLDAVKQKVRALDEQINRYNSTLNELRPQQTKLTQRLSNIQEQKRQIEDIIKSRKQTSNKINVLAFKEAEDQDDTSITGVLAAAKRGFMNFFGSPTPEIATQKNVPAAIQAPIKIPQQTGVIPRKQTKQLQTIYENLVKEKKQIQPRLKQIEEYIMGNQTALIKAQEDFQKNLKYRNPAYTVDVYNNWMLILFGIVIVILLGYLGYYHYYTRKFEALEEELGYQPPLERSDSDSQQQQLTQQKRLQLKRQQQNLKKQTDVKVPQYRRFTTRRGTVFSDNQDSDDQQQSGGARGHPIIKSNMILNPKTKRYVLIKGATGQKALSYYLRKKVIINNKSILNPRTNRYSKLSGANGKKLLSYYARKGIKLEK